MLKNVIRYPMVFTLFLCLIIVLAACGGGQQAVAVTLSPSAPEQTDTAQPPTPTTPPLAATVNGEGIWLEDYQSELARLQDAQTEMGKTVSAEEAAKMILDNLAAETLLAQAAGKEGYQLDDAGYQGKLDEVTQKAGGADKLAAWMQTNHYTETGLKRAFTRTLAADWERQKIIDAVPQTAEQVHASQILVKEEATANSIYSQLQSGSAFDDIAKKYEPLTGGDLGWFPRGVLYQSDVENAVFNLQPGEYSPVIKTSYGFHLVKCIERDPQHALTPETRLLLQHQQLEKWMKDALSAAKIEILIN